MSTNPYESPSVGQQIYDAPSQRALAAKAVAGPAISLMIVAGICLALSLLSLPFDLYLLVSGAADNLPRRGIDPTVKVTIRLIWGFAIFAASCYVFFGALQMKGLANYAHAKAAAVVACIPCLGPCCLLGIPFGAWALVVLSQPDIQKSFEN